MDMPSNQYQDQLVDSLNNLAGCCSQRVNSVNGSAFTNFQIYFTMKAISISNQTFSASKNDDLVYFINKTNEGINATQASGGSNTIQKLNNLTIELDNYF